MFFYKKSILTFHPVRINKKKIVPVAGKRIFFFAFELHKKIAFPPVLA